MILVIATMKVEPGNQSSYEKIMSELSATVREREPGVTFYQLGRSKADADPRKFSSRAFVKQGTGGADGAAAVFQFGTCPTA
ncbi:MAG: antibiotic biosynthesis monooxygenase [Novosphingobium sp.]